MVKGKEKKNDVILYLLTLASWTRVQSESEHEGQCPAPASGSPGWTHSKLCSSNCASLIDQILWIWVWILPSLPWRRPLRWWWHQHDWFPHEELRAGHQGCAYRYEMSLRGHEWLRILQRQRNKPDQGFSEICWISNKRDVFGKMWMIL